MPQVSRRAILVGSGAGLLGTSFGGCVPQQPVGASVSPVRAESVFRYPPRHHRELIQRFSARASLTPGAKDQVQSSSIPALATSTSSKKVAAQYVTGLVSGRRALPGRARLQSTTNRNGRIGTRPRR